ncbi:hypothetical protein D9V30_12290 [Mycetocola reblochoni]|uniref:WD40 repeat domain-containing protein n=1 Tax=Mycetocola reblochoni TaxID=331618 RepID=A0A3L6ZJ15_9MICO|nr:hypothetical protein D9V30_12290 [Mycetocola reblochoni]
MHGGEGDALLRLDGADRDGTLTPVLPGRDDVLRGVVPHPVRPLLHLVWRQPDGGLLLEAVGTADGPRPRPAGRLALGAGAGRRPAAATEGEDEGPVRGLVSRAGSLLVAAGHAGLVRVPLGEDGLWRDGVRARSAPEPRDPYAGRGTSLAWAERNVRSEEREPDIDPAAIAAALGAERSLGGAARQQGDLLSGLLDRAGVSVGPDGRLAAATATEEAEAVPERDSDVADVAALPDGRVLSTDRGRDTVRLWLPVGDGFALGAECVLPFGSRPSAIVPHPSGHVYVVAEAESRLAVLVLRGDELRLHALVPLLSDGAESGDRVSALALGPGARSVHAAVAGSGRLSSLAIGGDGSALRPVGDEAVAGRRPLGLTLDGRELLLASGDDGSVTAHGVGRSGAASAELRRWPVPAAELVVPAPPGTVPS